jgi:hypothetical protein
VSKAADLVQAILDSWEGETCPYCGELAEPWYLRISGSFTLQCADCDQVIETFELLVDDEGEPFTQRHFRWLADDGIVGKPYRVHVESG